MLDNSITHKMIEIETQSPLNARKRKIVRDRE